MMYLFVFGDFPWLDYMTKGSLTYSSLAGFSLGTKIGIQWLMSISSIEVFRKTMENPIFGWNIVHLSCNHVSFSTTNRTRHSLWNKCRSLSSVLQRLDIQHGGSQRVHTLLYSEPVDLEQLCLPKSAASW